ncbi:MAG: hypothetical protein ACXW27_05865 [Allosphingosinicella sp.]
MFLEVGRGAASAFDQLICSPGESLSVLGKVIGLRHKPFRLQSGLGRVRWAVWKQTIRQNPFGKPTICYAIFRRASRVAAVNIGAAPAFAPGSIWLRNSRPISPSFKDTDGFSEKELADYATPL